MAISEGAGLGALSSGQRSLQGARIATHILVFAVLMSVWYTVTTFGWVDPLILPSPVNVLKSLINIVFVARTIWYHFWMTLAEGAMGFVIGSGVGIGLAISAALSPGFRRYLTPYIVVVQVTPRIALAPIIIAWLGFGLGPIVAIAALVCFFPPFINTLTGLLGADEDSRELFRSLGASKRQVFFRLMLPTALPVIMAGMKTAVSLSLTGAVVGEFITGSAGLGVLVSRYTYSLNMASAFATLLFLALIGYLLFLITEILDSYIIFWRHDARLARRSASRAARWKKSMQGSSAL